MRDLAEDVDSDGFVSIGGPFQTCHDADVFATALIEECQLRHGLPPLSVIGSFSIGPTGNGETRDFQTLHFDFGLPLDAKIEQEVARYTALHVPVDVVGVRAVTRLVPLVPLLAQRSWPPHNELVERLTSYGRTHGARDDNHGYVEGSLARIIDGASDWFNAILPSVKTDPGFLCGLEFNSLFAEQAFFERHGLHIDDVESSVYLQPGELLVFDNLAIAHGRRGTRRAGELRQCIFGSKLQPADQDKLRDDVLGAFHGRPRDAAICRESIPHDATTCPSA